MNREQIRCFIVGWRRRNMLMLDYASCPLWLNKWRCQAPKGWGTLIYYLTDLYYLSAGDDSDDDNA